MVMRGALLAVVLGIGATAFFSANGLAAADGGVEARLDPRRALAFSEQAVGRTIGDYQLTDASGARFALRGLRGRPLVVSLVYTSCSSVCPPTTQHLIAAVSEASRTFGPDAFNVLTVGFDARSDTPARMSQFASAQGIRFRNWRVASADAATIGALLRDLGFSYAAVAGGFDHVTQTTLVDGEGRVYRQVYGDDFPLRMLLEPLKDVVAGTSRAPVLLGVIERVKFICTVFDPGTGRYRADYGLVFGGTVAALSLAVFGGLIFREWRRIGRA
jgi:protein SCO1/2